MEQLDYIGTLLQAIGIDLDLILATMVSYFIGPFAFHYCVHFLLLNRNILIIAVILRKILQTNYKKYQKIKDFVIIRK